MATTAEGTAVQAVVGLPPPDPGMPALEPAKNRVQYRERAEGETEQAVWYSATEPETLVEPQQVRLRSIHSKQAAAIVFVNNSKYRVRALWVDFKGNEVAYSMLEPNSTKRYHTYVTHPWIIREVHSATRMMLSGRPAVIGLSTEQTVEIQEPPILDWSLLHHRFFPESHKSSIRGLLLAHKALEPYAIATHDASQSRFISSPRKRSSDADDPNICASPSKRMCPMPQQTSLPPMPPTSNQTHLAAAAASLCSTATTSVGISSEAAYFRATLTVSSPRLASMKSTVNIELAGPAGDNRTTLNIDSVMTDVCLGGSRDQGIAAAAPAVSSSGCLLSPPFLKPSRSLFGMFKMCTAPSSSSHNMFKHLLKKGILPSSSKAADFGHSRNQPATMEISDLHATGRASLKAQQCDDVAVDGVSSTAGACWPPRDSHLGNLPSHLLVYIAELAAPVTWQSLAAAPGGRPDIKPTLMACPPITAEQQQQLEEQEQQAEQQQQLAQLQAGNQQ